MSAGARVAGTLVVLTLALAGFLGWLFSGGLDAGLVASHVKTFEGDDVEVKSCEEVGEAITNDDYGAALDEVWSCAVKRRDGSAGFAQSCYVIYNGLESGVERGIRCASVGQGCPAGGHGDPGANGRFLGRVIDPTLVVEEKRGNPPYRTVRVLVHHQAGGVRERCGYLNVRVPVADDPVAHAAELVEASGFSGPRYFYSSSLVGG